MIQKFGNLLRLAPAIVTGAALSLLPVTAAHAQSDANDPEFIVRMFYDFVGKGDCEGAVLLREGDYSLGRCREVTEVRNVETAVAKKTPGVVYLRLAVATVRGDKEEQFSGFAAFYNDSGRWRWIPRSLRSGVTIDQYVAYVDTLTRSPEPAVPPAPAPEIPAKEGDGGKSDLLHTDANAGDPAIPSADAPSTMPPAPMPDAPTSSQGDAASPVDQPLSASGSAGCWPPAALQFKPGEQAIRKVAPEARNKASPYDAHPPKLKELPASRRNCVRSVNTGGEKLVAFTFDVCEQLDEVTGYDGRIIDYLREQGVPATLYLGGKWMLDHPRRAKQLLADPLFEIGNHAWTHGNMRVLTGAEMEAQVQETLKQFYGLKGELLGEMKRCTPEQKSVVQSKIMRTFRFPYGTCSAESLAYLNANNIAAVQWDVVSGDPARGQTAAAIEKGVLGQIRPGSIVVMHANGRGWNTAAALHKIIPVLKQRGYRFVTVSELMSAGTPRTADECYELKPGDNKGYDRKFGKGTGED